MNVKLPLLIVCLAGAGRAWVARDVAQKYAPRLVFDQVQGATNKCFPSSAAEYYEARKAGSADRICNEDYGSLAGGVPVYWRAMACDEHVHSSKCEPIIGMIGSEAIHIHGQTVHAIYPLQKQEGRTAFGLPLSSLDQLSEKVAVMLETLTYLEKNLGHYDLEHDHN
ncbi:uncharacterized protein LOC134787286 [Penaeus indicus]|uniref:uncharacterized protein LOC134787286 n=1 Tax=Penaeus indicus TaxID=29960 RepID=UPI00300CA3F8